MEGSVHEIVDDLFEVEAARHLRPVEADGGEVRRAWDVAPRDGEDGMGRGAKGWALRTCDQSRPRENSFCRYSRRTHTCHGQSSVQGQRSCNGPGTRRKGDRSRCDVVRARLQPRRAHLQELHLGGSGQVTHLDLLLLLLLGLAIEHNLAKDAELQ